MDAAADLTELIGETPLLSLSEFAPGLYGKMEAANPYSVKDRIARSMVAAAEDAGALDADTPVVEGTSGNTGVGLAAVCAARGYDLTLTMPASMSEERRDLLTALGADLVLTPAADGMSGAVEAANRDGLRVRQFESEANPRAHRETTGPEIWAATDGAVDAVVTGVGTGGTVTGVAAHLKEERGADVRVVAVEPAESPLLSAGDPDDHAIQGIGPGFVPEVLRTELLDGVRTASETDATAAARDLATRTGLLVGVSSGAALHAAAAEARERPEETGSSSSPTRASATSPPTSSRPAEGASPPSRARRPMANMFGATDSSARRPRVGMTSHATADPVTDRVHNNSWSANLEEPRHATDRALVVAQAIDAVRHTAADYHVNLVTHGDHGHPAAYLFDALDAAFDDAAWEFVERCGCGGYVTRVHA